MTKSKALFHTSSMQIVKKKGHDETHYLQYVSPVPGAGATKALNASAIISAFLFERLQDPDTWKQIPLSPALQTFRTDWLNRRWDHLIFLHVFSEHGASTHFKRLVDESGSAITVYEAATGSGSVGLEIAAASLSAPRTCRLNGSLAYFYPARGSEPQLQLIPVQTSFHFRLGSGSELKKRIDDSKSYSRMLGLEKLPPVGHLLERPVLEFFSCLEKQERLLSLQEALLVSGLTVGQFEEMVEMSYCIALALYVLFHEVGIEVADGRLAYVLGPDGLLLAGSLGLDALFLTYKGTPIAYGAGGHSAAQPLEIQRSVELSASIANALLGQSLFADCSRLEESLAAKPAS